MDLGKELELRIADVLYFSPRFPFATLKLDEPSALLNALQDRVDGFYLQPASRCVASGDGFAGALICCAAIEFLALVFEEKSPSDWLRAHISAFGKPDGMAEQFWIRFRHGMMHEGYIKGQGQCSLELPEMVMTEGPVMVINPQLLLEAIKKEFREHCNTLTAEQEVRLAKRLHRYFDTEIKAAQTASGSQE